ncbi:sterol desaturase family protein [Erythrobacter sp. NFXS35]
MVVVPLVAVPLAAFRDVIPRVPALIEFWTGLPAAVALIAAIMLIDLAAYWRHRFEHGPELWRFHATHHADEQMNWLTLRRKHPLGEFLSLLIDLIPVLLLGLPIWAIAGAALVRTGWGYFIHADVPWTLGAFGQIMISPAAHRLHHIRDETLMGANYGNTITLWDRLFGTYTDPAPYLNCETGIVEGTRDVAGELLRPFEARYRRAKARTVNETPAL